MHSLQSIRLFTLISGLIVAVAPSICPAAEPTYDVKVISGIEFARPDDRPLLLDLHLPQNVTEPPLVMFIHGGGWKGGSRENAKLNWLATRGFALASIDYRLSQQALFPAQIHDCKGALRWLRAHAGDYGYDARRVVVAGTSAGGHLAALMGTSGGVASLEGTVGGNLDESSRVQGVLDYYGPTDFVLRSKTHPAKCEEPAGSVYRLLGGKVSEHLDAARLASPVTHVTADDPPLLILHGSKDTTVKLDQSESLRDGYQALDLEVQLYIKPGGGHGWKAESAAEQQMIVDAVRRWSRGKSD